MSDLKDKTAVVTGASRGIGKAIALNLAREGANLAICARNAKLLADVKQEAESFGIKCFQQVADVSSEKAVTDFIQAAIREVGDADILVNNAGIYVTEPIANHPLDAWQQVIDTNLTGPFLLSRALIPPMVKRGWGRIVNISSISGKVAEIYGSAYSASKFGLIGLTQALALETAKHGITVNAICPGWVATDMAFNQLNDEQYLSLTDIEQIDSVDVARLSVPQMRFIDPVEVADLVNFLCSDKAKGIHGQALNICGGLSLH
jgi:3-hydroxybutyrate dehydrogenase